MSSSLNVKPLSLAQRQVAYEEVKNRFALRGPQRTALDNSPHYSRVMWAAHNRWWSIVEALLQEIWDGTDR